MLRLNCALREVIARPLAVRQFCNLSVPVARWVEKRGNRDRFDRGHQKNWQEALSLFAATPEATVRHRTDTLAALTKAFQVEAAEKFFGETRDRRVVDYNTMISFYGRLHRIDAVKDLLLEMEDRGVKRSEVTFSCLINAYGMARDMDSVMRVMEEMQASGYAPDARTFSSALSACSKSGDKARAGNLFTLMESSTIAPTIIHFTSMVSACAPSKDATLAHATMSKMRQCSIEPNLMAYTSLLGCISNLPDAMKAADVIFEEMTSGGIQPDIVVYNQMLEVAVQSADAVRGRELLAEIDTKGLPRNRDTEFRASQLSKLLENEQSSSHASPLTSQSLPRGWCSAVDPTSGRSYYWQESDPSSTTTWEHPGVSKF